VKEETGMNENRPAPPGPRVGVPRRVTIALLALLLVASGMVIGSGATLLVVKHRVLAAMNDPQSALKPVLMRRLDRELSLTEEQYDQIDTLLDDHLRKLRAIRRSVWPDVIAANDGLRQSVGKVLDDEQREAFFARFDEIRSTFAPKLAPDAPAAPDAKNPS
jgi:hypothetical protein